MGEKNKYQRGNYPRSWTNGLTLKNIVAVASLAAVTATATFSGLDKLGFFNGMDEEYSTEHKQVSKPFIPKYTSTKKQMCLTGKLAGRKFGDLYTTFTGISGLVKDTVYVDFKQVLLDAWQRKIDNNKMNPLRASNIQYVLDHQVKEYIELKNPTKTSLEDHLQDCARPTINSVKTNLDWKKVSKIEKLDGKRTDVVRKVTNMFNEKDYFSYFLTELMSSLDGKLNMDVAKFIGQNAGWEYLFLLPAVHDGLMSYGPAQLTSYVVYDVGKDHRGASILNQALPSRYQIPGSMIYLKGKDHYTAAALNSIHNFAQIVGRLNKQQLYVLSQQIERNPDAVRNDLVQIMATAHNKPAPTYNAIRRWLDNGAGTEYDASCSKSISRYAKKTQANYCALYDTSTKELPPNLKISKKEIARGCKK